MKNKQPAIIMKAACVLLSVLCAGFFFGIVPIVGQEAKRVYPEAAHLFWPSMICAWGIALACFCAIVRFYGIAREIARGNSFCMANANAMRAIAKIAAGIACVLLIGAVALPVFNWAQPGIMLLLISGTIVFFVISMLARALSALIQNAAILKEQADLTI